MQIVLVFLHFCKRLNKPRFYFLIFLIAFASNSFSQINVTLTQLEQSGGYYGVAQLAWTHAPAPTTGIYMVQGFNGSVWQDVSQPIPYNAPSLSYNDTIVSPYCSPTDLKYRVCYRDSVNPDIFSLPVDAKGMQDNVNPAEVKELFLTLTEIAGQSYPTLTWKPSPSSDAAQYEVYRFDGFSWPSIGLTSSLSYTDKTVNDVCGKAYSYAVAAIDKCGRKSTFTSIGVNNMVLSLAGLIACDTKAHIKWNPYKLMPGKLGGYHIYRGENDLAGTFQKVATVTDTLAVQYDDIYAFANGNTYYYYVEAFSANPAFTNTSVSCIVGKTFVGKTPPTELSIDNVTVANDAVIDIFYHFAPAATAAKIMVERKAGENGQWQTLNYLMQEAPANNFLPDAGTLRDTHVYVHDTSYYYRLAILNRDCSDAPWLVSNVARSILLKGSINGTTGDFQLNWNDYEGWPQPTQQFEVYQQINSSPPTLAATIPAGTLNHEFSSTQYADDDVVCYYVKAIPLNNTVVSSQSNTFCFLKDPIAQIPNAFRPASQIEENTRFAPGIHYLIAPNTYTLYIYNRWGQLLFTTHDPVQGWNGEVDGSLAPMGVYTYRIVYRGVAKLLGRDFVKIGLLTLLRE